MLNFVQGLEVEEQTECVVLVSAWGVMTKFEPGFILGQLRWKVKLRLSTLRAIMVRINSTEIHTLTVILFTDYFESSDFQ